MSRSGLPEGRDSPLVGKGGQRRAHRQALAVQNMTMALRRARWRLPPEPPSSLGKLSLPPAEACRPIITA